MFILPEAQARGTRHLGFLSSFELLNPRAATLNENDEHQHKEHASNNPNNRSAIHRESPFFFDTL